jgi:peptide/nickel transport system permease protein
MSTTEARDPAPSPMAYLTKATLAAFNANKTSWVGLVIFLIVAFAAIAAPLLSPHDPVEQNILYKLKPPTAEYPLGTDAFGRDILSRLLYGARISLVIGFVSTIAAMLIGSLIDILAGWYGGRFDILVMQTMDMLLAFPSLILGLLIVAMLGPSMTNIILAIALTSVPAFARIARAPTIAVKEREYIEACRALGYSDARIMGGHILPNIFPEILVMGSPVPGPPRGPTRWWYSTKSCITRRPMSPPWSGWSCTIKWPWMWIFPNGPSRAGSTLPFRPERLSPAGVTWWSP